MNNQELEKRNQILERRWKIVLLIALIFVVTRPVAVYIINHYIHKAKEDALKNDYPLLDPARQIIPQEDYIINLQNLRTYLQDLGRQYPDQLTIYYEQLNSGANISVNPDLRLYPASLSKLAQAIIVAKKVEDKKWNWDTELTVAADDINSESGNLYKTVRAGDKLSVEELLKNLLIDSDNTAQNIFRKNVTVEDYVSLQNETGLEDLYNAQGFISSKAYSRMVRVLYTSSFLEREDSQKILDLMAQSSFKDYLSQGIPQGVRFAHKYGENKEQSIFADSGIVYVPNKPYMLTVLIKGKDSSQASRDFALKLMADISSKVYDTSK